jgi:alkylation response protein AidB-like acyl-CoA dehydrogenase
VTTQEQEGVDDFRARARTWLADNLERGPGITLNSLHGGQTEAEEAAVIAEARRLQRRLFDGGFAGICFPEEYGGAGLTLEHQRAFNEESVGYRFPALLQIPTFVPCAAVLVDFGTDEQKRRHLPAILSGREIWMQFLSEPSGGSDVAGALTTAVRDGDEWVLNGSKVWTTGAWYADYALCLARTNWDVPKHRGLSVFIVPIRHPGIELHRIEMVNGSREFCQEFLTDVRVPDTDRIGAVDDGWTVGTRWMFHERNAMGGASPYMSGPPRAAAREGHDPFVALARATGQIDDPRAQDLIGEARTIIRARSELERRIGEGMSARVVPDTMASVARLMSAVVGERLVTIRLDLAGSAVAASSPDEMCSSCGVEYLMRQSSSIGGGTTEMARNNISERVLGMPRDLTHDKNLPFRDIPKGPPQPTR